MRPARQLLVNALRGLAVLALLLLVSTTCLAWPGWSCRAARIFFFAAFMAALSGGLPWRHDHVADEWADSAPDIENRRTLMALAALSVIIGLLLLL